jgi:exo-beta-1,3-glucanase (GH17 family)
MFKIGRRHVPAARNAALDRKDTVVVWVDQDGNPISSPSPVEPAVAAAAPTPAPGSSYGIVYSPYNADDSCKSQDQVNREFTDINGFSLVRIYGVDCNQVTTVLSAAKSKGMKVFAGIFNVAQVDTEIQTLIAAAKSSWDSIDTVSIGNEVVNAGGNAASVVAAVNSARTQLRAAGYNGPVVTVDTFIALINHPELCQASDYAAANCHAFFAGVDASSAGSYVSQQAAAVAKACGGKKTVITESGWPHQGGANGQAVPSKPNQQAAIGSLKSSFSSNPSDLILFTAFDELWKDDNANTFGAEKFYGFLAE